MPESVSAPGIPVSAPIEQPRPEIRFPTPTQKTVEQTPAVVRTFTATARRLGLGSAVGTVLVCAGYGAVLVAGLRALPSPDQPIGNPWFSLMEVLILLLMPLLVGLLGAVYAWASAETRVLGLLGLVFMALLAGLTGSVHFVIFVLSRQAGFTGPAWEPLLSFRWPSVPYALDILGWDGFFALSVLCAAPVFGGSRLARWIRGLLLASGGLALAGLSGLALGDMRLRGLGIVGYAGVFPVAALLLAVLFYRAVPASAK